MKGKKVNRVGVEVGPRGYVLCQVCGKEATDICKDTAREYAKCVQCRKPKSTASSNKGATTMSTKVKKEKVAGKGTYPIKWFVELAERTQDLEKIREAAKAEKYADNTITIQIGRLRGVGLLPPAEKKVAEPKEPKAKAEIEKKARKPAAKKGGGFHPVPKPGHEHAAA